MRLRIFRFLVIISIPLLGAACYPNRTSTSVNNVPHALAVESFLADIAHNVAGDRIQVDSLMPLELDPHAFEPAPADVAKIAQTKILIVNGAGLEAWLQEVLDNAGGERLVIDASHGLDSRPVVENAAGVSPHEGDPHFWLDPNKVIRYTENIRDGFIRFDPAGKDTYTQNATHYILELKELDAWIMNKVQEIPPERRLLVTNHESLGYFANRYGFKVVGTVIPSTSTGASPSAQQVADLVRKIRATGAPAIFLETGTNPKLDEQIAREAGVKIVTDIYTHSLSRADGNAPTYLDMMRYNTQTILDSLK
jgi:ABC-type Zn uptake system ZnuABC Zn-binding protein ZnuA